jgi:hypothetical protein
MAKGRAPEVRFAVALAVRRRELGWIVPGLVYQLGRDVGLVERRCGARSAGRMLRSRWEARSSEEERAQCLVGAVEADPQCAGRRAGARCGRVDR